MSLIFIELVISPILDLWIFYKITNLKFDKKAILFSVLFIAISILLGRCGIDDFTVAIIQIIGISIFYLQLHKEKEIFGAAVAFELFDLCSSIVFGIFILLFGTSINNKIILIVLAIDILLILLVQKFSVKIHKLLTDENNLIFISLISYIYLSSEIVYYFVLRDNHITEVLEVSLSLLILQILFAILAYITVVHIQNKLLTKQKQKEQKLQLELIRTENKELILKQKQLANEMQQLQEYSNYLDKNEDDLRRFKHDYQNILNGLKVSAEEGDIKQIIKKLDQYTDNQFDQKALRKYKGVNHIHEKNLKSIAIAKLSKLYSLDLNYSFDCERDIRQIPASVNIFDLIRIIGITFDNAAEESLALIKETSNADSAQVDAMYYQENGNFEFEIRNRVRKDNISTDKISQKNFTTKKHHMGLGLANVKEIAHKYEETMIINYYVDDGWFTFDLTILPDNESEAED